MIIGKQNVRVEKRSLKRKFLYYLLIFAFLSLSFGTIDTYRIAKHEIKAQLLARAQLLASAINHASMIADNNLELEHVSAQVMQDNPEITALVIVSSHENNILYEQNNQHDPYQLKTLGQQFLQTGVSEPQYLDEQQLIILVPIKNLMVEGQGASTKNHHKMGADDPEGHNNPELHSRSIEPIGAVFLAFNDSVISNGITPILLRMLPTSLISIIMLLVLCYLLLNAQVLKPIGGIRKVMVKQQSGDQSARAYPHDTFEIDDMARSLNNMLDTLTEREKLIKTLAMTDPLTGLANRSKFHEQLETALNFATRNNGKFAVAYIDLDRFKKVNDTYGHQVGDNILKAVAQVLKAQTRPYDTVARLGGDEFAIIAIGISQISAIKNRLIKIIENISNTNELDQYPIEIGASIGIAFYPTDATTGDDLIAKSDEALYQAKASGRGVYCIYDKRNKVQWK